MRGRARSSAQLRRGIACVGCHEPGPIALRTEQARGAAANKQSRGRRFPVKAHKPYKTQK